MCELENESPLVTDEACLEDITALVFETAEKLEDCKFIAKEDYDLNETMTAIEMMDQKMDVRL